MIKEREQKQKLDKITMIRKAGCTYGFGDKKLDFPFFTMANDYYAQFMTQIMKHLEVRFEHSGNILIKINLFTFAYEIKFVINDKRVGKI